jgi:hypothetical protein
MAADPKAPPYRREVFKHWLNVSLLVAGGAAGLVFHPLWWVMLLAVEGGALWIAPDVPVVRKGIEKKHRLRLRRKERAYYLSQLFGLEAIPERGFFARLFLEDDGTDESLDGRLLERRHADAQHYLEMRDIVRKLRELTHVRGARISEPDLQRLEEVINGYLRLLFACIPLRQAVSKLDDRALRGEMRAVEAELSGADPAVRPVLLERLRIARAHLERLPQLQARLQLFRTRADSIVHQVRQIHGQVLADPGTDVTNVLDTMIERQDLFNDPIGDLAAEQMVRDLMDGPADKVDQLRAARNKAADASKKRAGQKN